MKSDLEKKHGIKVYVIPADLSDPANAANVYEQVRQSGMKVTMLINNAGVGVYGQFAETPLDEEIKMISLNISSLVILTKLFLPDMKAQKHGRIMNLCSLLSFFPFPYFSVYAATKSFVLSFTEALRSELSGTGISVTALCPGPTDSGFTTDGMAGSHAYKMLQLSSPTDVAHSAVKHLLRGSGTVVIGIQNKILASTPRFSPRWMSLLINKFMGSPARF